MGHHFERVRPNDFCQQGLAAFVDRQPRVGFGKPAFHAEVLPHVQHPVDARTGRFGLQPQRVSAKIDGIVPVVLRQVKLAAEAPKRVGLIEVTGKRQRVFVGHGAKNKP